MFQTVRKSFSVFLATVFLVGGLFGSTLTAFAAPSAGSIAVNDKVRHTVCHALSDQALAYYTEGNTYEDLIQLDGKYAPDDSASAIGSALFNRLQSMMKLTNTVSYSSLLDYWDKTDANGGSSGSWLFYSDRLETTGDSTNREHVWPKSRGNFGEGGAGSDLHHLRPTNASVNSTRSNYTMGDVRSKTGYTIRKYADPKNSSSTVLWYISDYRVNGSDGLVEVADNIKGDVARIYLYLFVTYGSANSNKNLYTTYGSYGSGGNDGKKVIESLATLLEWNRLDPVDEWEMRRNDLCQDVQGNRNVFIDYPELAWYLFNLEDEMPFMNTPSGNAHGTSIGYVVNAESSNDNFGTVAIEGRTITATPKSGYYVSGYTVTYGSADVTRAGNTFSVVPYADCTIMVEFQARDTVQMNLISDGAVFQTASAYTGRPFDLPLVSAPEGWTFLGWITEELPETNIRPVTIYNSEITPTGETTLYALFTRTENATGTGNWTRMETDAVMAPGLQIVFACPEKEVVAGTVSGSFLQTVDCKAFSGNIITALPDEALVYTVGGQAGAWTFTSGIGQLYTSAAKNVNFSSQGTGTWAVSIASGSATVTSTTASCGILQYNASQPRFNTYTSNQMKLGIYYLDGTSGETRYSSGAKYNAHTHQMIHEAVQAATCTESGHAEYWYCADCGNAYLDEEGIDQVYREDMELPALGHALASHKGKAPTCTEIGWSEYVTCSRCNYTTYAEIPKRGHSFGEEWLSNEEMHWKDCRNLCGEKAGESEHVYEDDEDADCDVCGYVRTIETKEEETTLEESSEETTEAATETESESEEEIISPVTIGEDADVSRQTPGGTDNGGSPLPWILGGSALLLAGAGAGIFLGIRKKKRVK